MSVPVFFVDFGAAAEARAVYAERAGCQVIAVHSGLCNREAFEALAALVADHPDRFPVHFRTVDGARWDGTCDGHCHSDRPRGTISRQQA